MSSVQKLVTDEDIFPTKYGEYNPLLPPSGASEALTSNPANVNILHSLTGICNSYYILYLFFVTIGSVKVPQINASALEFITSSSQIFQKVLINVL